MVRASSEFCTFKKAVRLVSLHWMRLFDCIPNMMLSKGGRMDE